MSRRQFLFSAALIVLAAFGLREWFVLTAWCPDPTRGDAAAYVRYALHLAFDGTFSQQGAASIVVPDAYRAPGYPWLLRLLFRPHGWFEAVSQAQVILGTLTVACTIALAREWMARGWALAAGAWMGLQAHNIAATGTLLTEVLFGACLVAALLLATLAYRRRSLRLALAAGAVFGMAYLTNPVIAFLPLLLVPVFWRGGSTREGIVITLLALLVVGGWATRNAVVHAHGDERAVINFVQGSWPEYHTAWKYQRGLMHDTFSRINAETAAAKRGDFSPVKDRIEGNPLRYAAWYLSKPRLLFDWNVRIGQGGAYTVLYNNSPLDRRPLLWATILQIGLNGALFWFALAGILLAWRNPAALMVATALVYLTAVHVVLQAEPRYAIPYRSLEIVLAMSAASALHAWVATRLRGPTTDDR